MLKRKLIDALTLLHPLSAGYESKIREEDIYIYRLIKKDTPVLMPGKDADELSFVCRGVLKLYRYDEEGEQLIYDFFFEDIFMMLSVDFYDASSNKLYYITALYDSELLTISRSKMNDLYAVFSESRIHADRIRSCITLRQQVHIDLLFSDPSERYGRFLKLYPELARLLNEIDICRFLGISKRTLNRSKQSYLRGKRGRN